MTSKAVIVGSASTRLLAQKISELETKVQELESGNVVVKPTEQNEVPTTTNTDEYKIVVGLNQGDDNVLTMTLEECPFENWIISCIWCNRNDTTRSATKTGNNTYQVEFNMTTDTTDDWNWYIVFTPADGDYTDYKLSVIWGDVIDDKITRIIAENVYKVVEPYNEETRKVIIQPVNGESFSPKRIFNEDFTKEGTFTDIGNNQYELGYPADGLFEMTALTFYGADDDEYYCPLPLITAQALRTTGAYILGTPTHPLDLANAE